ncbi:hypothetical protein [Methylotenera sp.]|uniref:hypothetical protein n=1 Tax=Methylotenera sp. TaxID=2051956 RepID=UPI002489013E|nr:hypothetical protein [Methylotenera sp.]MDI1300138.1 hypothetical protein [Methylotenera sp.]
MDELEHLKSMWAVKAKRKTDLIVPKITHQNGENSLNNDFWAFKVPYAFRAALDIKYEERKKDKKSYLVWTQGAILAFKNGDSIHSRDGSRTVQVNLANPMGWDAEKKEMYQGGVAYTEYAASDNSFTKQGEHSCTQMQFLELLIHGSYKPV